MSVGGLQGQDESRGVRAAEARAALGARHLSQDRRLRGVAEDPGREAAARADHRRGEGIGPARPRRRGISHRHEVELHAAQLAGAEISRLQLGRERARHLPRSRHPALQPAFAHRRAGDRRLRHERHRRLQLHPRRVPRRARAALRGGAARKPTPPGCSARTSRAPASISTSTRSSAPAPTSAAKKPRCSIRSKASRASRASSRRFPRTSACTARRPRSTTRRASRRCPRSCARVRSGSRGSGPPNSGGTVIFSVSGHVDKPGNFEVPLGIPFADLLEIAGGMQGGRKLKAVIPGGSSVPVVPGDTMMKANMDYDSLRAAGSCHRFRGRHRHGRDHLHGARARAHLALLHVRVLRPVHAVPRRHRLDEPPAQARARRAGASRRAGPAASTWRTASKATPSARSAMPRRGRCRASSSISATSSNT